MFILQNRTSLIITSVLMLTGINLSAGEVRPGPDLGEPADSRAVSSLDWGIMPDGAGLPQGSGTAEQGRLIYEKFCVSCHGPGGLGDSGDQLAGAQMQLTDEWPEKTIGNYWPYAPTLFDFIRRSKPMMQPGSLTDAEVYALTAYLLYLNEIIAEDQEMNADTLADVAMPNRDGFIQVLD